MRGNILIPRRDFEIGSKEKADLFQVTRFSEKKKRIRQLLLKTLFQGHTKFAQFNANSNSLIIFTTPFLSHLAKQYCVDISVVYFDLHSYSVLWKRPVRQIK